MEKHLYVNLRNSKQLTMNMSLKQIKGKCKELKTSVNWMNMHSILGWITQPWSVGVLLCLNPNRRQNAKGHNEYSPLKSFFQGTKYGGMISKCFSKGVCNLNAYEESLMLITGEVRDSLENGLETQISRFEIYLDMANPEGVENQISIWIAVTLEICITQL